jgi:hypothetical protein
VGENLFQSGRDTKRRSVVAGSRGGTQAAECEEKTSIKVRSPHRVGSMGDRVVQGLGEVGSCEGGTGNESSKGGGDRRRKQVTLEEAKNITMAR